MSETSRSQLEDNGSVQYIDLVVERCLEKGRVSFKNAKQMGRVLQLQDFPRFVFEDWQDEALLAPESSLLGEYAIVRAVPGADAVSNTAGKLGATSGGSTLGYLVPNGEWIASGAQWTAATTVGWGRWIFRMDDAKADAGAIEGVMGEEDGDTPISARSDVGPPVSAEEKRIQFDSALTTTRLESNESFGTNQSHHAKKGGKRLDERYVFKPALQHMVNKINHHIISTLPMLDTVMTCEEWGDLLLELGILDGPVVTSQVLTQQPVRFLELSEWNPPLQAIADIPSSSQPSPSSKKSSSSGGDSSPHPSGVDGKDDGDQSSSSISNRAKLVHAAKGLVTLPNRSGEVTVAQQNKGGMLFSTSEYPELEAAAVVLFAKRLQEKMSTFIRTHEYKVEEAAEFARDTTEDSSERLQLTRSEHLLEVNKLFHVHLTKTLSRLRGQRTMSIEDIAESIEADCLSHFPGDWPKQELGDELCV